MMSKTRLVPRRKGPSRVTEENHHEPKLTDVMTKLRMLSRFQLKVPHFSATPTIQFYPFVSKGVYFCSKFLGGSLLNREGFFTILTLKKNITYVYTPFEDYFLKCHVLLDYREIDLN